MSELLALADQVAGWANDGEQVEVYAARSTDTEIRAYDGEVESLSSADAAGLGIRVVVGDRQGFAYAGSLDPDIAKATLEEARDNAAFATPDEWVGLPGPDDVAFADLALFDEALTSFPPDDKVALALELERAVKGADGRITGVESAEYGDSVGEVAVVSTTGIRASHRETSCWLSAYALAGDGDETQTGFGWSIGREPSQLDAAVAAADTARRATQMLGATKPATQSLTVILEPFVTAQLLGIIASTLSGDAVLKQRSPFADRLGEQVAAAGVTLIDDPTDVRSLGAAIIDDEGLACRRNGLITDGVLNQFVHSSYTGRRAGTASTGSAIRGGFKTTPGAGCRALALVPGTRTPEELAASLGEGLLVRSVAGIHSGVNPISGDFSTGAEGIMIRGGELAEPVREFTIASTLQRMLLDIVEVGGDLEWLPMSAAGVSLVVTGLSMSGT